MGTGSQGRETGGQGLGTEGQGQETGGQGQKTADQGRKNVNRDTGPGQGTNPGTEEIDQGREKRKRKRKGTDPAPETGITKNTRKIGHERGVDQHQGPGVAPNFLPMMLDSKLSCCCVVF